MLKNLAKAAVAVTTSPLLALADLATLPASAYNNQHPFRRARAALRTAGRAFDRAVEPQPAPKAETFPDFGEVLDEFTKGETP